MTAIEAESTVPTRPLPGVYKRVAAVADEVKGTIKYSGKTAPNQGARPALSIGDCDEALVGPMARHGLTSDYEFIDEPRLLGTRPTSGGGVQETWLVHLWGYVVNVDGDPPRRDDEGRLVGGDLIQRELWDTGSNISGAVSFTLKRWLRELFKIVEHDDQPATATNNAGAAQGDQARGETPASAPKARKARDDAPPAGQGIEVPTPQLSGRDLAIRAPLYAKAKEVGRDDAWVDACLEGRLVDRPGKKWTAAQVMQTLEKWAADKAGFPPAPAAQAAAQAATKPAETAKATDGPPDPERLVCPISGHDAGPGKVARPSNVDPNGNPDGSGQYYRCTLAAGGCGAGFHISHAITRAEYDRRTSTREAAQAAARAETSPEMRTKLNEVAGFDGQMCALCGLKGEHAPDCTSFEARESRGEVTRFPEGATAAPTA